MAVALYTGGTEVSLWVRWKEDEERLLRDGRVPAGTDRSGCTDEMPETGWPLKGELRGVYMTPRVCSKKYGAETLRLIQDGVVPDGMSVQGCRYVARTRLGIEFRCRDTDRVRKLRVRAI